MRRDEFLLYEEHSFPVPNFNIHINVVSVIRQWRIPVMRHAQRVAASETHQAPASL